jgi:hypothetical protein
MHAATGNRFIPATPEKLRGTFRKAGRAGRVMPIRDTWLFQFAIKMTLSSGKYREIFMAFSFETRQLECKMELYGR